MDILKTKIFSFLVCRCGQQSTFEELIKENALLKKKVNKLKKAYLEATNRTINLTDTLTSKVLGTHGEDKTFTEEDGYPSAQQLKAMSNQAIRSDYIFVKLLMEELWPEGFYNRSVTGRASNNPFGRPPAGGRTVPNLPPSVPRIPLEKDKVEYIKGNLHCIYACLTISNLKLYAFPARLVEHRVFRGDTPAVAKTAADAATSLMKRVLSYYGKSG